MQLSLRKSGAANEQSKVYFVVCYNLKKDQEQGTERQCRNKPPDLRTLFIEDHVFQGQFGKSAASEAGRMIMIKKEKVTSL